MRGNVAVVCLLPALLLSGACALEADPHPMPFKVEAGYLAVAQPDGSYRQIFVRGVNLGAGLPGTQAGELALSTDQYLRWFDRMSEIGVNVVRVYTLHYPRFYEAVFEHNNYRPDNPLYIMQGIWLDEEHPTGEHTLDLYDYTSYFKDGSHEVIGAVHGDVTIGHRLGRAYGEYTVDISDWVIAYVLGREVFPNEVYETQQKHSEKTEYRGEAVSIAGSSATDVWWAEALDEVLTYERDQYGVARPTTVSSWPTLDPLHHYTEPHSKLHPDDGEDQQQLDLANLDLHNAPAGYFASFHAYPYYPNFISEQPEYIAYSDYMGPNSYLGYLHALVDHYAPIPVLVGEFGVPTSWGNAHYGHSGMNHGGHTAEEQAIYAGRMFRNMLDSGSAGGLLFAWQDEWWKRTWIVNELSTPRERYKLWHNVTSPEQNFGLIEFAFDDPKYQLWPAQTGTGLVREVAADYDGAYFHARIKLSRPLQPGETLVLGYDTYRDDLGETLLPDGTRTQHRNEFAAVIKEKSLVSPASAQLMVLSPYDLEGIWHGTSTDSQLYKSIPSDVGNWSVVRWKNDGEHTSDDGMYSYPPTHDPIGQLHVLTPGRMATQLDAVVFRGDEVEVRMPWTLLHFSDPSQLQVIHDDKSTRGRESLRSDGIALSVSVGGDLVETRRFVWPSWDAPLPTREVEKPSMNILADQFAELPHWMDEVSR